MLYSTLYNCSNYESGGILSPGEIDHEAEIISKSIHIIIEQQFNKFEKRVTIYHGDSKESSKSIKTEKDNTDDVK